MWGFSVDFRGWIIPHTLVLCACLYFLILKIVKMKIITKIEKYQNRKVYYAFNLIDICFINSFQVIALNITICNILIQFHYTKKRYK